MPPGASKVYGGSQKSAKGHRVEIASGDILLVLSALFPTISTSFIASGLRLSGVEPWSQSELPIDVSITDEALRWQILNRPFRSLGRCRVNDIISTWRPLIG